MKKQWGGERPGAGRPLKAEPLERVGMLFLPPADVARLAQQARDGETLMAAARRLLGAQLDLDDQHDTTH